METPSEPGGDYWSSIGSLLINNLDLPTNQLLPAFATILNPNADFGILIPAFLCLVVLLFFSALVSGSEVAFFSLSPQQRENLAQKKTINNQRILHLLQKPRYLLATILIANNLFNIAIILTGYFITKELFAFTDTLWWLKYIVDTVVITFILVLLGEVMPKVYATHYNLRLATFTALPLSLLNFLFRFVSYLLVNATSFIERQLKELIKRTFNPQEMVQAIDIVANGSTSQEDIDMLKGIIKFRDITVTQVMCNRIDVFALENTLSFPEMRQQVIEEGYSRVPIYQEDLDHIVGILYVKDLLEHLDTDADFAWQNLVKPVFYIPETKKIYDLLKEMQEKRTHLAVVVDEYGGTSGLITLEDIIEEIVGEIQDEYDDENVFYRKVDTNNYVFAGKTSLHDVCKVMRLDIHTFEPARGESESLAGLLLELKGHFPEKNEPMTFQRFQFIVLSKENHKIEEVRVSILHEEG